MPRAYDYSYAALMADCGVFDPKVLLIQRASEPFKDL